MNKASKYLLLMVCINFVFWGLIAPENNEFKGAIPVFKVEIIKMCKIDNNIFIGNDIYMNTYTITNDNKDNFTYNVKGVCE